MNTSTCSCCVVCLTKKDGQKQYHSIIRLAGMFVAKAVASSKSRWIFRTTTTTTDCLYDSFKCKYGRYGMSVGIVDPSLAHVVHSASCMYSARTAWIEAAVLTVMGCSLITKVLHLLLLYYCRYYCCIVLS